MTDQEHAESVACPECGLVNPAGAVQCECGYAFEADPGPVGPPRIPSGVGGWLGLLTAVLLVMVPLSGILQMYVAIPAAESENPALRTIQAWASFKAIMWSVNLTIAAISVYAGWGLARGATWRVVRRAKVALWVVGPVAIIVLGAVVPMVILGQIEEASGLLPEFVRSVMVALVWTLYLSKSKRVRATYGAEMPAMGVAGSPS